MKHTCGGDALVIRGPDKRSLLDAAMGTCRRTRRCMQCNAEFVTTEIDASDLADLRRKAYLYVLGEAQKGRAG